MERPLLSIIIPTRNRELYCIEEIKHILSFENNDFELIIQDNSDTCIIEDYVKELCDSRLLYYHEKEQINFVINMDIAVSNAKGEFAIMLGDDDTILPNIFSWAEWMRSNDADALTPLMQHAFFWNEEGKMEGTLIKFPNKGKPFVCNAKRQLRSILNNGIVDYQAYYPPRLYHGLIRRSILDKIKEKTGHYIGGLSPDIYVSVSSCFFIDNYYAMECPISIQGVCPQSNAYAGSHGTHQGRLSDAPHFYKRGSYEWEEIIPPIYSVMTIWAETAIKAIKEVSLTPQEDILMFDKKYFLTVFLIKNKTLEKYYEEISLSNRQINYIDAVRYYLKKVKSITKSIYWRITKQRKVYRNVESWQSMNKIKL